MKEKVDLDSLNREGRSALILAVIRGFPDIVHLLVKSNASLDIQDAIGCTALHYAVYLGDSGLPLFYHATKQKRTQIAEQLILLEPAEALNKPYEDANSTVLHIASETSQPTLIQLLISEKRVSPTPLDAMNRKPIDRID
ncbi:UNVERIFIED_CONTAM: hypothetical protein HDU68_011694 [Siphonaria sp. JEL0065]|nr:hypothetical protein HDU68_011694 [Siphonaria sp. JEL0065]